MVREGGKPYALMTSVYQCLFHGFSKQDIIPGSCILNPWMLGAKGPRRTEYHLTTRLTHFTSQSSEEGTLATPNTTDHSNELVSVNLEVYALEPERLSPSSSGCRNPLPASGSGAFHASCLPLSPSSASFPSHHHPILGSVYAPM